MLELPEAYAISRQITETLRGKTIVSAQANASPHGFAWFYGDPTLYPGLLAGRTLGEAAPAAGQVQLAASGVTLLFADGVNLRYYAPGAKRPQKHQLLLEFDDDSALAASVQMYGGLWAYPDGMNDNPYYLVTQRKPSPLTEAFDAAYFETILREAKPSLSVKALLATEQRIPGLGNGVLQDILFLSGLHPQRRMETVDDSARGRLFDTLKATLRAMADQGGRDTEKDLLSKPGGYRTLLSRKTWQFPCPQCGGPIERKAYLGGNVYFCGVCQPLNV